MTRLEKNTINLRCMFCEKNNFESFDEITAHQNTITSKGINVCTWIKDRIDSRGQKNLIPARIAGKKYAPKNHDGIFVMYTPNGKLAKDPTYTGKNYLHYQMLHGKSGII